MSNRSPMLIPSTSNGVTLQRLLKDTGLVPSMSESRRHIVQNAVKVNGMLWNKPESVFHVGFKATVKVGKTKSVRVEIVDVDDCIEASRVQQMSDVLHMFRLYWTENHKLSFAQAFLQLVAEEVASEGKDMKYDEAIKSCILDGNLDCLLKEYFALKEVKT